MKLANIFTDNMVLAANKPIRIFGDGSGDVSVTFLGKTYTSKGYYGKWEVELDATPYGGPYEISVTLNQTTTVLKNVYVGEVILCAGQSNIEWQVSSELDAGTLKDYPLIRIWLPETMYGHNSLKSWEGWKACTKENVVHWTAVGYHLAEKIHNEKGCAVGVIGVYRGATMIQSFIRRDLAMRPDIFVPDEKKYVDKIDYPEYNYEGKMYDVCFSQVKPMAVNKVVWYQGETNTGVNEHALYGKMLEVLIHSWREDLRDYNLPFAVIQIHDYFPRREDDEWKSVQRQQAEVASKTANAYLIESRDVSPNDVIHPQNKTALANKIYKALYE